MTDKPSKPQEHSEPGKRPVPPRQNDPLLGDHAERAGKPVRETKQR